MTNLWLFFKKFDCNRKWFGCLISYASKTEQITDSVDEVEIIHCYASVLFAWLFPVFLNSLGGENRSACTGLCVHAMCWAMCSCLRHALLPCKLLLGLSPTTSSLITAIALCMLSSCYANFPLWLIVLAPKWLQDGMVSKSTCPFVVHCANSLCLFTPNNVYKWTYIMHLFIASSQHSWEFLYI